MSVEDEVTGTENQATEEVDNTTDTEGTATEAGTKSSEPEYTEHERKMFKRAKEAEAENKRLKAELEASKKPKSTKDNYDLEDVAVLVSQVPNKEDRETVKRYAKVEGKTLEEALNDPLVKSILKERLEMRKTAEATNTSGSKRTSPAVSDEQIVNRFLDGRDFDPEKLAEARINLKKQKK